MLLRIRSARASKNDLDLFSHTDNAKAPAGESNHAELPAGWSWSDLGEVSEISLGRTRNPGNRPSKNAVPYIRAANIREEGLDLSDILEMDFSPKEIERYRLRRGDLVVAEASGSALQVGKPAQWNEELPLCCFQNTVVRLRPVLMDSDYLLIALKHHYYSGTFAERSAGVGINHIGAHRLAKIEVPVPPLRLQRAIAGKVAQQLSDIRDSRAAVDASMAASSNLRESLLSKAFSGGLVKPGRRSDTADELITGIARSRALQQQQEGMKKVVKRAPRPQDRANNRRALLDVLREQPNGITPEDLFASAGFKADDVDDFYAELSRIKNLRQILPSDAAVSKWPGDAKVTLSVGG